MEWFVCTYVIETDCDVKSHDGIVEEILVELTDFFIGKQYETYQLRFPWSIFEIGV